MAWVQYILIGAGCIGAWAAFSGPSSDVQFAVDAQTARDRLSGAQRIVNGTGMGSLTLQSAGMDGERVRISIQRAGDTRSIVCLVAIEPDGDAAAGATVDCSTAGPGQGALANKARRMMAVVVREHVVASVEQKPYDIGTVSDTVVSMIAS